MVKDEDIANIRQTVTMRELATSYGYRVTPSGFCKCPFHNDKSPSMKIYDGQRGYYCFVCNKGGDIYDFVMEHDGVGFEAAVRSIADRFGIPISDGREVSQEARQKMLERQREREAMQNAEAARQKRLQALSGEIQLMKDWLEKCTSPVSPPWREKNTSTISPLWMALQKRIENLSLEWEYLFAGHDRHT